MIGRIGVRSDDVTAVLGAEVDLDRGHVRISRTITEVRGRLVIQDSGKTDAAERSIALDRRTVDALVQWHQQQGRERTSWPGDYNDAGLVFTYGDGTGLRSKRLSSNFTAATDRAGLPRLGAHGLRHTYATAARRAGVSPEVVSTRLGHASVVITLSIYAHMFEQDDQAAAEMVADAIHGP